MKELPVEISEYLFNHQVGVIDAKETDRKFIYLNTTADDPYYRYSIIRPEILQHYVDGEWRDIWLSVRREQTELF